MMTSTPVAPPRPSRLATATTAVPVPPPADRRPEARVLIETLLPVLSPRYEIVQPLVRGGMATLFLLRHRLTAGLFAIKVLHPHLASRPEIISGFRAEAINAARLGSHPNIVPVYDLGERDGTFYMIMPFIEGEDLDRLLTRTGHLSRAQALTLAAQMGSALAHAERCGIVHADISPGNIRLDSLGNYRLLDFGLSRLATTETRNVPGGGTPAYNSPEQLRGEVLDVRSDLYSLGVTLFEALTGQPLYTARNLDELARMHQRGAWKLPPALEADAPVAALLGRLLAANRDQRMESAFSLLGALSALGYDVPLFERLAHPDSPPLPEIGKHRHRLSEPA